MHFSTSRYCSKCHSELTQDDCVWKHGWCHHCCDTVEVTRCKVPYWVIAVTLGLLWVVHLSGTFGPHMLN